MYIGVITNFQKNLTMNFKFRITKYLAVSALAVLLLGACSKKQHLYGCCLSERRRK